MKWRRILVWLVIIIVAVALLYVGAMAVFVSAFIGFTKGVTGADDTHPATCAIENPDNAIEQIAEFKLPASGHLLESSCMGLQGWFANAKFEMDPEDLDTFVSSTKVVMPLANTGNSSRCPNPVDASTPHLFGDYEASEFYQAISIDISNPALYIVYVCVLGG